MSRFLFFVLLLTLVLPSSPAKSDEIKLDWSKAELGFFEEASSEGANLHGVVVYVSTNRLAKKDDFNEIYAEICNSRLKPILEAAFRLTGVSDYSLMTLQLEFEGAEVDGKVPYLAVSATIALKNGSCAS